MNYSDREDSAPLNIAQQAPTVISECLREYAANPGYSHSDYADSMISGAEEIEIAYGKVQYLQTQLTQAQEENARLKAAIEKAAQCGFDLGKFYGEL
jgi:hypothetical protein